MPRATSCCATRPSPTSMAPRPTRWSASPTATRRAARDGGGHARERARHHAERSHRGGPRDSRDAVSGEIRHFQSIKKPFTDAWGNAQILVIAHDITDVVDAQQQVAQSEETLRNILDNVDAYIYLKDVDGRYLFANRAVRGLWEAEMEDIIGARDDKFFDAKTADNIHRNDRRVLDHGETLRTEEIIAARRRPDGDLPVDQAAAAQGKRRDLRAAWRVGRHYDHKAHQRELERVAHYDVLTDLPNRILLAERMQQAIIISERTGESLARSTSTSMASRRSMTDMATRPATSCSGSSPSACARRCAPTTRSRGSAVTSSSPCCRSFRPAPSATGCSIACSARRRAGVRRQAGAARVGQAEVSLYPQVDDIDADQLLRQADQAMYLPSWPARTAITCSIPSSTATRAVASATSNVSSRPCATTSCACTTSRA